ncbi:hypothetical protein DUNSADRAFT_12404 [Dunaliella salina]|uniref:Uncharacterized protein n=1 Tax=Dunaliella salina TaxID=3046 RepID=A0ABQ7GBD1_DUNSA|nr:hypothetical protein DUNSADRAFT_12404 [Dunaliella salina]|eukprot:KAF5831917.1 hypothetical protein DUNSADRAFT_12404 [Dunaliella salina]
MGAQRGTNISYNEVSRLLGGQWADLVTPFLQALVALQKGDRLQACQTFREKHCRVLMDLLGVESWVAPALSGAASTLKELSVQADGDSLKRGGQTSNSQLAACAMMLQQMFSKTAAAKGQDASYKKARSVAIGCVMLKTYFRLSTITNCKNVIQTIDNVLKVFDQAEAAHRVTYRYYTGRLLTYDERFQEADEHLTYAFRNCDPSSHNNKRRILRYLIPIHTLKCSSISIGTMATVV